MESARSTRLRGRASAPDEAAVRDVVMGAWTTPEDWPLDLVDCVNEVPEMIRRANYRSGFRFRGPSEPCVVQRAHADKLLRFVPRGSLSEVRVACTHSVTAQATHPEIVGLDQGEVCPPRHLTRSV
jgi:hypothetical protein